MKYRLLTKEQFESLHHEFAQFLATQSIDAKEWKELKKDKPHVAEEEMAIFSDVVWEEVLTKTNYVAHFSKQTANLFKCNDKDMQRIVVKTTKDVDLMEASGLEWLLKNPQDDSIEILQGNKAYAKERNAEIFDLIEKGGNITKGEVFEFFNKLINS